MTCAHTNLDELHVSLCCRFPSRFSISSHCRFLLLPFLLSLLLLLALMLPSCCRLSSSCCFSFRCPLIHQGFAKLSVLPTVLACFCSGISRQQAPLKLWCWLPASHRLILSSMLHDTLISSFIFPLHYMTPPVFCIIHLCWHRMVEGRKLRDGKKCWMPSFVPRKNQSSVLSSWVGSHPGLGHILAGAGTCFCLIH